VDTTKAITHISLCSGYEGIGLGLRSVLPNLREIAYVEREGFPIANLVSKIEAGELDEAPVFTDVKTFPYRKFRGCVDILSGGFPCQPFSAAGKRQATEDPRHLFPYIADGIRECQPRIVFLENVAGIISAKTADGESVLQYVLRELEGLGYRATAGVFSASEVGAPHQRKRVFILGLANGERSGMRGGGSSQECGDDLKRIQGNEGERNELRGEASGCSRDLREEELGNTSDLRLQQHRADSRETSTDQSGEERRVYEPQGTSSLSRYGSQSQGSQELADRIDEGSQGRIHGGQDTQRQGVNGHVGRSCSSSHRGWPSRPGERQHDWEAPRVTAVGDTTSQQGSSEDNGGEPSASSQSGEVQSGGGHSGSLRDSAGQAQSRLGRTPNGAASRVDRLRLLGNGVVPATATKAFVTLIQRFNNA
jgi:DNA (cytosine-5)-methyltransferase 1